MGASQEMPLGMPMLWLPGLVFAGPAPIAL